MKLERYILQTVELILMALQIFMLGLSVYLFYNKMLVFGAIIAVACILTYVSRSGIGDHLSRENYEIRVLNRRHKRALYRNWGIKKKSNYGNNYRKK